MLRKGFTKHNKLIVNLHLLLKRGKLAGKALTKLLLHHHPPSLSPDITSLSLSPEELDFFFHAPDDVEFSCSNTPSPAFFLSAAKRLKSNRRRKQEDLALDVHVAAALVKELEILSLSSPVPAGRFGKSLAAAPRQLRITDSSFPAREEEEEEENDGGRVDREAEAFIRRFYDQLRLQQSAPATPEFNGRRS